MSSPAAYVLKNQSIGSSWNLSGSLSKTLCHGLSLRGAYSYGEAKNTIDPGLNGRVRRLPTTRSSTIRTTPVSGSRGTRRDTACSCRRRTRSSTSASVRRRSRRSGRRSRRSRTSPRNVSYVFNGDMNGDGFSGNDLIYIPRDTGGDELRTFTHTNGRVFTAAEQATAFEAYIQQDPYLSEHRGEYAQRGGMFLPMFNRMDLSLIQDVFKNIGGKRNAGQFRFDVTNFGNLLNHDWGVSKRTVVLDDRSQRRADPDQRRGRSDDASGRDLSDGGGQQRALKSVVPDEHGSERRVSGDVQLQVYVQLVVGSRLSVFSSQWGRRESVGPFLFNLQSLSCYDFLTFTSA